MRRSFALLLMAAAIASPGLAGAQSFNCAKAFYADEKRICREPGLSRLDEHLARVYAEVSRRLGERGLKLEKEEDAWVRERRNCGPNYRCIERKYLNRIAELNKQFEDLFIKEFQDFFAATRNADETRPAEASGSSAPAAPASEGALRVEPAPIPPTPSKRQSNRERAETAESRSAPAQDGASGAAGGIEAVWTTKAKPQSSREPISAPATSAAAQPEAKPAPPPDRGRSGDAAARPEPSASSASNTSIDTPLKPETKRDRKRAADKSVQAEPRAASTEGSGGSAPVIRWVNPPPAGDR